MFKLIMVLLIQWDENEWNRLFRHLHTLFTCNSLFPSTAKNASNILILGNSSNCIFRRNVDVKKIHVRKGRCFVVREQWVDYLSRSNNLKVQLAHPGFEPPTTTHNHHPQTCWFIYKWTTFKWVTEIWLHDRTRCLSCSIITVRS